MAAIATPRLLSPRQGPSPSTPRFHSSTAALRNPGFTRIDCFSSSSTSSPTTARQQRRGKVEFTEHENRLVDALIGIQGRGRSASPQQLKEVENAVQVLEDLRGVADPAEASIADRKRILFRFGKAAFSFKFLPFKVPYPVPFRLLGDEAKGWLDTTYLLNTGNFRISRGNKGTTFVLQKETEPRQQQLSAISADSGVREAIDNLISTSRSTETSELELSEGDWKMIWSSQVETDSWLGNAANGLMVTQIVSENGQLKFLVDIFLGSNSP